MDATHEYPMFGAVYFRKTNPPAGDWERDYARASADGHTIFRHWISWGAVETSPGRYDWGDYDRHLDLASKHGIRTVLAEISTNYPEWLIHKLPHAALVNSRGEPRGSPMHVSCVLGGNHALCMDNHPVAEACGKFLSEMARRYSTHRGLYAWDVWNECSMYGPDLLCHCPATVKEFRDWLKARYGTVDALGKAWKRYSYTGWDEVQMPRETGSYPDVYDRIEFHNDRAFHWMKFRVDAIRRADPGHAVTAHGNAKSFSDIAPACGDDFRAAKEVDVFGYTYWHANQCHPFMAVDMIRSASGKKRFWRAEAVGDSEWTYRGRVNAPARDKDAMHDPANIRLDALVSLAGGSSAFMNPRWRPLLDGPLFGAYGWYAMDGSPTDRSAMAAQLAKWAADPALAGLWRAAPVAGDVAILMLDESQASCYARHGHTRFYADCLKGAYEAFLVSNIQCDFTKVDAIGGRKLLYVPYPVAMKDSTVAELAAWVRAGGMLVCEACPGYFDGHGHAFPVQPSRGLDEVFGCREQSVAFAPDLDEYSTLAGPALRCSLYRQSLTPTTGRALASHPDGSVAVVLNSCGKGRTLLVGRMPGYAYRHWPADPSRQWFASLPGLAGFEPRLMISTEKVVGRLWHGESGHFLWLVNTGEEATAVKVRVSAAALSHFSPKVLRGSGDLLHRGSFIETTVPGRDAVILALT